MFLTTRIPGNRKFDSTLDLKREGYLFIKNRTEQLHSDAVMVHMMGMPFICLSGREAARIFYDPEHFQRSGVIPRAVQKTVTGKNSVLDLQTAASELINVLLPTVAVTTYIVFSALALHEHPEWRERLRTGGKEDFQLFAKEVRRFYPFAPFLAAKVKESFRWKQFRFSKGAMVLLDLYGTDHDSRVWRKPNEFQPERFKNRSVGPFDCVETGGGDVVRGHKSPGGAIAERIMEESLDFLVNRIDYETPAQDFSFSMNRMPSIPNSGLILSDVRRRDSSGTGYPY